MKLLLNALCANLPLSPLHFTFDSDVSVSSSLHHLFSINLTLWPRYITIDRILRPNIVVNHATASPSRRTLAPKGPVSKCQYKVGSSPYLDEGLSSSSSSSSSLEADTLGPPNWERKLYSKIHRLAKTLRP